MSAARSRVTDPERIIKETFREAGYADGWTESVLADYAHELAEKQRAAEAQWRQSGYEGTRPKGWLIDLIDPEVSTDAGS